MIWNRVWACGRDTYLRAFPNPGVGLRVGDRRVAVSWRGGIEVFQRGVHQPWVRTHKYLSRVTRPGGV